MVLGRQGRLDIRSKTGGVGNGDTASLSTGEMCVVEDAAGALSRHVERVCRSTPWPLQTGYLSDWHLEGSALWPAKAWKCRCSAAAGRASPLSLVLGVEPVEGRAV